MKTIKHIITLTFVVLCLTLHGQSNNSNFNTILESIIKDSSNFIVSRKRKDIPKILFSNIKSNYNLRFRISNSKKKIEPKEYVSLFCSVKRWLVFVAKSDNYIVLHYVLQKNNTCVNTIVCVKKDGKILDQYLLLTGYNYSFMSLLDDFRSQKYRLRADKSSYL